MNLLYIAPLPIDFGKLDGVQKKIICQAEALNSKFSVDIIYYFQGKVYLYNVTTKNSQIISRGSSKIDVLSGIKTIIKQKEYHGAYIRYPSSDMFFINALKKMRNNGISIVMEIPTYPYDKEGTESLKGRIINYFDRIYRRKLHKYIDRIVTYSKDDEIFGVKTIKTINGIDFSKVKYDCSEINVKNRIDLIAVSAMYRVHGYERLIEGLHDYYSNGGKRFIVLKLVGKGDECEKYVRLVNEYGLQKNVIFCGTRFGKDLDELYKGNAVGINSLAIHRQGLVDESTLKTKEYAAKGLPVISSSYVDAFSRNGNQKYVLRIPADESNVAIDEVISFVDKVYTDSTKKIRDDIRSDGQKTCDITITMNPVIHYFEQSGV